MKAMTKETLRFDATVICPECGNENATLSAGRKYSRATINCPDCGKVREGIIKYGGGLEVSSDE